MFEDVFSAVETTERASKYLDELSGDERELADGYCAWLEASRGLKSDTAKSYKSNLARAVHKTRVANEALTSDERVAVRAFREFCDQLAQLIVANDELEDELVD